METNRRQILKLTPVLGIAAYTQQLPEPMPQIKPELVKEFVGRSHADINRVKELAKQEPMLVRAAWDQGGGDWETGLGAASHMGRRDIAQFLLDSGARVDAFAIFMLGSIAPAKSLLEAFPTIHKTPGPHGIPLLSHAIVGRQEAMNTFDLLLNAGADVNAAAWRGITPLMQAVLSDRPDMVRALLSRGADAAAKTPAGLTALDFAKKRNSTPLVDLLRRT